jgi:endonuclease III
MSIPDEIVKILKKETKRFTPPLIDHIVREYGHDPFLILIGCLLSLRARDVSTIHVCRSLFKKARTPKQIINIPLHELEKLIYKTGFYKTKTQTLKHVSHELIERFSGKVPDTYELLISIKGVGPKTANLVLGAAFNKPAMCVDTHVHRISNRLGLIKTSTVEESEKALEKVLNRKYWNVWNNLLVMWGQNICVPISPKCSQCAINILCKKVGVTRHR